MSPVATAIEAATTHHTPQSTTGENRNKTAGHTVTAAIQTPHTTPASADFEQAVADVLALLANDTTEETQ
jgi:hypothetical protein